jgi:curved DNA-binding protein CbpA
MLEASGRRF